MKTSPALRSISLVLALFVGFESTVLANASKPEGCPSGYTPSTANKTPDGTCPTDKTDTTCAVDPVLLTGGKLFLPITDVQIPGPGRHNENHLKLYRCYSSRDGFQGVFGHGWVSTLDLSPTLTVTVTGTPPVAKAGSSISFRDQDGSLLRFTLTEDTPLSQTPIVLKDGQRRLKWTPGTNWQTDGVFLFLKPHGTVYRVDLVGGAVRVHSITDRNGNKISYGYDDLGRINKLTDDAGRSLLISYGANGKVGQLKDPLGRTWSYAYDNLNNLVQVTEPLGRKETYGYEDPIDPHNMTGTTDASGYKTMYSYNVQDQVQRQTKPDGSTIQFTFNDLLGTSSMIDEFGRTWRFEYHKIGLGTLVVAPDGSFNEYSYDPNTNAMTSKTDALGRKTQFVYDSNENISEIHNPAGHVSRYEFDPTFNFLVKSTDALGHSTARELDSAGNVVKVTDALGNSTTSAYDSKGQMTSRTDAKGNTTTFAYDAFGNLIRSTDALGNATTYAYDLAGRLESTTDAKGRTTRFTNDAGNRLTQVQFADGSVVKTVYDDNNRVTQRTDANGNATQFEYGVPTGGGEPGCGTCSTGAGNASASPNKIIDPLGNVTQFTYDAHGNRLSVKDANGNTTAYAYDSLDRMTSSTDALGGVTTFEYDAVGNLLKVTDAAGHPTTFTYDALNRRASEKDALGNQTSFTYDPVGNLLTRADANGKTTSYQYDAVNRLTKILYPDASSVQMTYDAAGNLTRMLDPTGTATHAYDKLNRVVAVVFTGLKAIYYAYDSVGNVMSVISNAGRIDYGYDALNRMKTVVGAGGTTAYSYDPGGRRTQTVYPNGVKAVYAYDKADRLLSLSHVAANPAILLPGFAYTHDPIGNRLTLRDNEGTHAYTYDKLYRLKSVTYPLGNKNEYSYDQIGNRLTLKEGAQVTNYSYDAANRLLSAGARMFAYDSNGNLVSEKSGPAVTTYVYDFENRLKSVKKGMAGVTYAYDGLGRRVSRTAAGKTRRFFYDGFDVRFETAPNGTIDMSYTHGARIDEILVSRMAGQNRIHLTDGLGSTAALLPERAPRPLATYSYDVFGSVRRQTGQIPNDYLFTGRELDSTSGLYYYRNRWYSAGVGRFTTEDPIGLIGGINKYIYVADNPVNRRDPDGLVGIPGDRGGNPPIPAPPTGGDNGPPLTPPGGGNKPGPGDEPDDEMLRICEKQCDKLYPDPCQFDEHLACIEACFELHGN